MKLKILVALLIFGGFHYTCCAQNIIQSKQYPKNFFRYPLDLSPSTAGSFGELRPNHFHSGLDFKTNHQTGYPVHAISDGYISRLKVQFGGFGNAVYITHPNGYTSVYGHLERFSPKIAQLVRDYQYKQQSHEIDFKLDPLLMPVCKDDVIAWSGNTGASAGPHLHFEIRDTQTEETINPQLFGLTINDNVPPSIGSICIYNLNGRPFSENTARNILAVAGANGHYHLARPQVINVNGETGFGISTNDMNSTSPNHNGVYSIELKLDGKTVYTFAVERFAFDQTHAINAYIDYPLFIASKRWMQKCFILPGSKISLYPQSINRGIINIDDDAVHDVEYIVKDIAGNASSLTLKIRSTLVKYAVAYAKPTGTTLFHFDQKNEFSNDKVKLIIQPGNLYDDVNFTYSKSPAKPGTFSSIHHIHNRFTPIHDNYELWIKPDDNIGLYAGKAVIVSAAGVCEGGNYEDGYVKAQARTFGDFYIMLDTVPPAIHPINIRNGSSLSGSSKIILKIGDNLSGIKTYSGKIDGKWVLMDWDYKSKILSYTFDNNILAGKHFFELTVGDNKDNISKFTAEFYR